MCVNQRCHVTTCYVPSHVANCNLREHEHTLWYHHLTNGDLIDCSIIQQYGQSQQTNALGAHHKISLSRHALKCCTLTNSKLRMRAYSHIPNKKPDAPNPARDKSCAHTLTHLYTYTPLNIFSAPTAHSIEVQAVSSFGVMLRELHFH